MIKILLACVNQNILLNIQTALNSREDINIIGKADNLHEIQSFIKLVNPTIIVISDLNDEYIYQLAICQPNIQILEVAARCDWERALCLIQYGVKAILMYDDLITHLSQAIREISQGNYFLSASIVTSLLKMICHTDLLKMSVGLYPAHLTNREYDVVKLLVTGRTDAEIANELIVSVRTVRYHITNMMLKLQANNRTEIAIKALKIIRS